MVLQSINTLCLQVPRMTKNDQHQLSPNNINTYTRGKVTRIYKMITKGNMLRPFNKFSQLIFNEVYRN